MLFTLNRQLKSTACCQIAISGEAVKRVDCTKFLGVLIDDSLTFKCHIDHLVSKLSKYVGLFYRVRHLLPQSALLTLYKTLFEPHLNYCNVIWGNTFPSHLKKLQALQKKVIRALAWAEINSSSLPLFHRFQLLRLTEKIEFHKHLSYVSSC